MSLLAISIGRLRSHRWTVLFGALWCFLAVLALMAWAAWGIHSLPPITIVFLTLIAIHNRIDRQALHGEIADLYHQLEARAALHHDLDIRPSLPPMRSSAISPDAAAIIASLIHQHRPQTVLELGSGVSTIVTARALKQNGQGKVLSIDHDELYAGITRGNVARHPVEGIVDIRHTPMVSHQINGQTWTWYDISKLPHDVKIDMLVVDGPPSFRFSIRQARYPAMPLLKPYLNDGAIIVMDDSDRIGELEVVERWIREFNLTLIYKYPTEKGTTVLRYNAN